MTTDPQETAWDYMLRWFGVDDPEAVQNDEVFKKQCDQVLAQIFDRHERTIKRMGKRYENMPDGYLSILGTLSAQRQMLRQMPQNFRRLMSVDDYKPGGQND